MVDLPRSYRLVSLLLFVVFTNRCGGEVPELKKRPSSPANGDCQCLHGRCEETAVTPVNASAVAAAPSCVCDSGWTGAKCDTCFERIVLNASQGIITDGPGNYSENQRCTWLVDGRPLLGRDGKKGISSRIVLSLTTFATECGWDHVYFYQGDNVYGRQLAALSGELSETQMRVQYVAEDTQAFVYFMSDLGFNMSGFNLSYRTFGCPYNCNTAKQGTCLVNGTCACVNGYTGVYCEIPPCSAVCSKFGTCREVKTKKRKECVCNTTVHHGSSCSTLRMNVAIDPVYPQLPENSGEPRASHAAALIKDTLWLVGGYTFAPKQKNKTIEMHAFNITSETWVSVKSVVDGVTLPEWRYDHSLVAYKGNLYMYGGVLRERNITNEFWKYDMSKAYWQRILEPGNQKPNDTTPPLPTSGHTANVFEERMVVLMGYNPYRGYVNLVQEYFFSERPANNSWSVPATSGVRPLALFGHTTVYDDRSRRLLVYGGYHAMESTRTTGTVSDRLYSYDPLTRVWHILSPSRGPVFRHGAAIVDGVMWTIGGNAHNESSIVVKTQCYSTVVRVYDLECDIWYDISGVANADLLARFGHVIVAHRRAIYVQGGFDGALRNDFARVLPGDCTFNNQQETCVSPRQGTKCVWVATKKECRSLIDGDRAAALPPNKDATSAADTRSSRIGVAYAQCPNRGQQCDAASCLNCLSGDCEWCTGQRCAKRCDGNSADLKVSVDECPEMTESGDPQPSTVCGQYHSCYLCQLHSELFKKEISDFRSPKCTWLMKNRQGKCVTYAEAERVFLALNTTIGDQLAKRQQTATPLDDSGVVMVTSDNTPATPTGPLAATAGPIKTPVDNTVLGCPLPCAFRNDCKTCNEKGSENCMWCSTKSRCVEVPAYMPSFPYGQCKDWTSNLSLCPAVSECSEHQTCASCRAHGPQCGWCDDGSGTGLGKCMKGGYNGPVSLVDGDYKTDVGLCRSKGWFFVDCPACQCNGHAPCIEGNVCDVCKHNTTGDHCQNCLSGHFGNPLNGGNCTQCECNNEATECDQNTGKCFCTTKGVVGDHCDKCAPGDYMRDPRNPNSPGCFYKLTVDFIFTFRLGRDEIDKYKNQINFVSKPPKPGTDVSFKLTCKAESGARVNLSVASSGANTIRLLKSSPCSQIERRAGGCFEEVDRDTPLIPLYQVDQFTFVCNNDTAVEQWFDHVKYKIGDPTANTTFYVYVHDFKTPIQITISFAQTPPIPWVQFFIIFVGCFLLLLVTSGVVWRIKVRLDVYRRRQRLFVEMAQMASRPFGTVHLDLADGTSDKQSLLRRENDGSTTDGGVSRRTTVSSRRSSAGSMTPSAISVEPCADYKAAVVTVAVRLPTGGGRYTPAGQSGLAVASSLVVLPPQQSALLKAPPPDDENSAADEAEKRRTMQDRYFNLRNFINTHIM